MLKLVEILEKIVKIGCLIAGLVHLYKFGQTGSTYDFQWCVILWLAAKL